VGQESVRLGPGADPFFPVGRCCMDEWLSFPVWESLYRDSDKWEEDDMVAFRDACGQELKVSNMRLEGNLSEIRSAVPIGKSVTSAEKQSYMAVLGQLAKLHNKRGGRDPREQDKASELLERGVPLDHLAKTANLRGRPDKKWCVYQLQVWRAQHPLATRDMQSAYERYLRTQWAAFTPEQMAAATQEIRISLERSVSPDPGLPGSWGRNSVLI
jgi:hypothetical protein